MNLCACVSVQGILPLALVASKDKQIVDFITKLILHIIQICPAQFKEVLSSGEIWLFTWLNYFGKIKMFALCGNRWQTPVIPELQKERDVEVELYLKLFIVTLTDDSTF